MPQVSEIVERNLLALNHSEWITAQQRSAAHWILLTVDASFRYCRLGAEM